MADLSILNKKRKVESRIESRKRRKKKKKESIRDAISVVTTTSINKILAKKKKCTE